MPDRRTWMGSAITRITGFLRREGKRIVVGVIGGAIVVVGLVLMPLPGPGMLIVLAGLAILATQFAWAQDLRDRIRAQARDLLERLRGGSDDDGEDVDDDRADRRRGPAHDDRRETGSGPRGDRSDVA